MTQTKYVTTPELAAHFNIASSTVAAMVRSGEIPSGTYVRIGRVFRFDLDKVEQSLLDRSGKTLDDKQLELDFDSDDKNDTEETE
jgi:excisionase family DNA binding protein